MAPGGLIAVGLALVLLASAQQAVAATVDPADSCPRSAALETGPANGAHYRTAAPFEHFDAGRSHLFPHSCALGELSAGGGRPAIATRRSPENLPGPWVIVTRERDELFLYGYGADPAVDGGYVASLDPETLRERWRARILDEAPADQWSYPGALVAHGNGFLYAVYGNRMVKLDPATGAILARRSLPEPEGQGGVAYNGIITLPDGRMVLKYISRGPYCPFNGLPNPIPPIGALLGIVCASVNLTQSSDVVLVDPDGLEITDREVPPEAVGGRLSVHRHDGVDYVYAPGATNLFRYRYAGGALELDRSWGPVPYRSGLQGVGSGPGFIGDWVIVQTNASPSLEPLSLTAVDVRDASRRHVIRPFGGRGTVYGIDTIPDGLRDVLGEAGLDLTRLPWPSWIFSKPAFDAENATVISHDTIAGQVAAVAFDPTKGFHVEWRHGVVSTGYAALIGPTAGRQVVITDYFHDLGGDRIVWLDLESGRKVAHSGAVDRAPSPGNIVTPGFRGRFYYLSSQGRLVEASVKR